MNPISSKLSIGVPGLDDVLGGGLPRHCLYLVEGNRLDEKCLYVTLSETKLELEAVASSHGWNLEGISIIELSAIERAYGGKGPTTLFQSAEVELTQLTKLLMDEIERGKPARLVLDSLSEMRMLAQTPLRYRREVLRLK